MKRLKIFNYAVVGVTGALIIFFAVWRQQSFIKTLPTLVTLLVMLLSARANRYTFLLGGLNAAVYGIVYIGEGLYFSAMSSILISFPIQIFSFFNWKRHSSGIVSTRFASLSPKWLSVALLSLVPAWAAAYFGLSSFISGSYPVVDCYLFVAGILVSVLSALRFIEAQYINAVSCLVNLTLWIVITTQNPANINYVFISCYNLIMVVESAVTWTKKYREQIKDRC